MKTITLTDEDFEILLLMCGYATGAAHQADDLKLGNSFLRLANEINKNNPKWTPYEIDGDLVQ